MGRKTQHRCHGSPGRFESMAAFIAAWYGGSVTYIADVAGGQGLLSRILNKKYNYTSEVIDPRGRYLRGVSGRGAEYVAEMADYYDLIIGLHPDQATRPVAASALSRPVVLVPCCNFWADEKLGTVELVEAIEAYYREHGVCFERVTFDFKGPKNIGLVSEPPS